MAKNKKSFQWSALIPDITYIKSGIPFILLFVLALVYIWFDTYFVQCKSNVVETFGCIKLQGNLMSQVDTPILHLSNANVAVTDADTNLGKRVVPLKEKEKELIETRDALTNTVKKINEAAAANTNVNTGANLSATKTKQEAILANLAIDVKNLTDDKSKAEKEVLSIRRQISSRYASRMIWVFLASVFAVLSIAAILFSIYVMVEPFSSRKAALWCGAITVLAIGFAVFAFRYRENYMSIVESLFKPSIAASGDLSLDIVNLFNVMGFAAIIFMIGASCSIYYKIETATNGTKEAIITKCKKHAQTILYIGAAMLFTGMLRVNVLSDWHLAFVSDGQDGKFYELLENFFKSSLSVQAGFYTIILAVIYLPVAYRIWTKEDNTSGESWFSSFSSIAPRFLTIISPLLATPLSDLFTGYLNT